MTEEDVIVNLVVNGGDGKGKALMAIDAAKAKDWEKAHSLLEESKQALSKAHHYQTELLQSSIVPGGDMESPSMLVVHGQDHLMTAMLAYDIAVKMVEMYELFFEKESVRE